ncbi:MAG: O-acetylhomoserine aminocarboxypropyltransferase/cysteine synthase [Nitrospinae bacterium]|nr:O-acetylhomoserine aminocarboxypropyltransferase/cysteine synthase [Nitrospinota bacterium]
MTEKKQGIETIALHAGHTPDKETLSRAVPIYQTTSYAFRDADHAANLFALKEFGNIYTRLMNPTTGVLEARVAALHGRAGSVATASGMAAIFYAIANIANTGQNIVTGGNLYGGTYTMFTHTFKKFGIEVRYVDSSNPKNFEKVIDANTRLLYTESIGNPACNVDDIKAIADIAHAHQIPLIVDNTVSPPPMFDPFQYGADIVVYSLTKIIGGHGTSLGGMIVEEGSFDWKSSGKFPEITEPDKAYHGANFWDAFGGHDKAMIPGLAFTLKIRTGLLRDLGAALSPFNAQQILLGVETLPLRVERHLSNAQKVAEWLAADKRVTWVNYAGLPSHRDHARAKALFPMGPGAIFGFGVKGGYEAGKKLINSVKLCSHLANVLDAKTLVIHSASTTHQQLTPGERAAAGAPDDMVRISVGLENVDDIIDDLDQALAASQA